MKMRFERLGFLIFFFTLTSGPLLIDPRAMEPFGPIKYLGLGIGGLFFSVWLSIQKSSFNFFKTSIGHLVIICFLIASLSSLQAISRPFAVDELCRLGLLIIIAAAAHRFPWQEYHIKIITHGLLIGATINGIFMFAEHFNWDFKLYQQKNRLIGLFGYQNLIAQFLIVPTTLGIYFCSLKQKRLPWIMSLQLIFLWIVLIVTLCRGAWIGLFISHLYLFFFSKERKRLSLIKPFIIISLGIGLGYLSVNRPTPTQEDHSPFTHKKDIKTLTQDSGRLEIYKQTVQAIKKNPILGSGPGNYPVIYQQVDRLRNNYRRFAHNDILQWITETGLLGLIFLLALIILVLKRFFTLENFSVALGSCLLATFIQSLVSYNFYKEIPVTLAAWALGVITPQSISSSLKAIRWALPLKIIFGLILIFVAYPKIIHPIQVSRIQKEASALVLSPSSSQEEHLQKNDAALKLIKEAQSLTPHDPSLLWHKSQIELTLGKINEAEESLAHLSHLTPGNDRVHLLLANIYTAKGQLNQKVKSLEKALVVLPETRPLMDELWIHYSHQKDSKEKLKKIEIIYKEKGWWADNKPRLATRLQEGATREELINTEIYLRDQLLITPTHIERLVQHGSVCYQLGLFKRSLGSYEKVLEIIDQQKVMVPAELHANLLAAAGNVHHQLRFWEKGHSLFEKGFHLFPEDPRFFHQVFRQQIQQEGLAQALQLLVDLRLSQQDKTEIYILAAQILGNWVPANKIFQLEGLDILSQLVEGIGSAQSHIDRGDYLNQIMSQPERALNDYKKASLKTNDVQLKKIIGERIQSLGKNGNSISFISSSSQDNR